MKCEPDPEVGPNEARSSPDRDPDPFLVLGLVASRIRSTSNLISKTAALRFKRELGLTTGEWRSILFLGHHGPMTINRLAEVVDVDRSLMSRLLSTMSRKGFVLRRPETHDRRQVAIDLTARGLELYGDIRTISLERNAAMLKVFSHGELEQLEELLAKLSSVAKDWLGERDRSDEG